MQKIDIHSGSKKLDRQLELAEEELGPEEFKLIRNFVVDRKIKGVSDLRLFRYVNILRIIRTWKDKPFKE